MRKQMAVASASCVKPRCQSFLETVPTDYPNVKCILLDPSVFLCLSVRVGLVFDSMLYLAVLGVGDGAANGLSC